MSSNTFGTLFRFTTFGESHGPQIGVVVDGCPAGLAIDEERINARLAKRAPGGAHTSPRKEPDRVAIMSGVFMGQTTGAPICLAIANTDARPDRYEGSKNLLRPGHANYTYMHKYGIMDYRGGGRASARETACRVAAGAVAEILLETEGIATGAFLESVGKMACPASGDFPLAHWHAFARKSPVFACDANKEKAIVAAIDAAIQKRDSIGGVVAFRAEGVPMGLGEPVYNKIEAMLASAMLGIPAAKGFAIGKGFEAATMYGSEHNDLFLTPDPSCPGGPEGGGGGLPLCQTATNHAGGCLGGITSGMPLYGRVAFKPTPSIQQSQETVDMAGKKATFTLPDGSRHDPCLAVRAVPVVEAMCQLVLADALLLHSASSGRNRAGMGQHCLEGDEWS